MRPSSDELIEVGHGFIGAGVIITGGDQSVEGSGGHIEGWNG